MHSTEIIFIFKCVWFWLWSGLSFIPSKYFVVSDSQLCSAVKYWPIIFKKPEKIIYGGCYRIRSEKTLPGYVVLLCCLKLGSLNQLVLPMSAPAHFWYLVLLPEVQLCMLSILWLTTFYWNRTPFVSQRWAARLWKPDEPSWSISLTREVERSRAGSWRSGLS